MMRSVWSFLLVVFALAALLSPSLAVGLRTSMATDIPAAAQTSGISLDADSPCTLQGGARVLPAERASGDLADAARRDVAVPVIYWVPEEIFHRPVSPARDLPPPRAA